MKVSNIYTFPNSLWTVTSGDQVGTGTIMDTLFKDRQR